MTIGQNPGTLFFTPKSPMMDMHPLQNGKSARILGFAWFWSIPSPQKIGKSSTYLCPTDPTVPCLKFKRHRLPELAQEGQHPPSQQLWLGPSDRFCRCHFLASRGTWPHHFSDGTWWTNTSLIWWRFAVLSCSIWGWICLGNSDIFLGIYEIFFGIREICLGFMRYVWDLRGIVWGYWVDDGWWGSLHWWIMILIEGYWKWLYCHWMAHSESKPSRLFGWPAWTGRTLGVVAASRVERVPWEKMAPHRA